MPESFALKPMVMGVSLLFLSGCATFSKDGGLDDIAALTQPRTGQTVNRASAENASATEATVTDLLAQPLTPDSAVQIAFLNNKGLQASLAELGVAEADLVQAGRMRNPVFSFSRLGQRRRYRN